MPKKCRCNSCERGEVETPRERNREGFHPAEYISFEDAVGMQVTEDDRDSFRNWLYNTMRGERLREGYYRRNQIVNHLWVWEPHVTRNSLIYAFVR